MEYADTDTSNNHYKVLKLLDGSDVLCKILQEYEDALVVECPMSVTKQQIHDRPDHIVEHTGLQRWISFTNDTQFVISKEKILGSADLSPEVMIYYKMISRRAKAEALQDQMEHKGSSEDEQLEKLRVNIEKLQQLMEGEIHSSDHGIDTDFDDNFNEDINTKDRILH
tara:strand:- start:251 stop:754 length:504 start_codon:yes stop_codon:yes gene_type:complete